MIKRSLIFLVTLAVVGCARVTTLNLEKHEYSKRPNHIIWFQIAGFSEEHIPLLRFNVPEASYHTSFEKMDCLGKMWNYNLYELRPDSTKSFLSQLNGSKNMKGQCEDYAPRPAWSYLSELGYASSIFENGASEEQSLERALKCSEKDVLKTAELRFYRMGPGLISGGTKKRMFHYQDSTSALRETMKEGIYYDKSCQNGICYSSLSNNFKTFWGQISKTQSQTFFLVRDFNFINGLKKKDISYAKESLQEIERIIAWINAQKREDVLVLITGAESLNIEFPKEGKEWEEFERSGKNVLYRNSSLMSPVIASGPMSENFCGMFDESEMLKRLMFRPAKKKFGWDILNPFID